MKTLLQTTAFALVFGLPLCANAQESSVASEQNAVRKEEKINSSLKANLRKIELKYSQNSVSNQKEYHDSPDAALSADEQSSIVSAADFALEYQNDNL